MFGRKKTPPPPRVTKARTPSPDKAIRPGRDGWSIHPEVFKAQVRSSVVLNGRRVPLNGFEVRRVYRNGGYEAADRAEGRRL